MPCSPAPFVRLLVAPPDDVIARIDAEGGPGDGPDDAGGRQELAGCLEPVGSRLSEPYCDLSGQEVGVEVGVRQSRPATREGTLPGRRARTQSPSPRTAR